MTKYEEHYFELAKQEIDDIQQKLQAAEKGLKAIRGLACKYWLKSPIIKIAQETLETINSLNT